MRPSSAVANKEKPVRGVLLTMAEAAEKTRMSVKWIYARMVNGTPFSVVPDVLGQTPYRLRGHRKLAAHDQNTCRQNAGRYRGGRHEKVEKRNVIPSRGL